MDEPSKPMPSSNATSRSLGADREALETAEHVGEPQAHEADVALLDGAEDEIDVLLLIHGNPLERNGSYSFQLRIVS